VLAGDYADHVIVLGLHGDEVLLVERPFDVKRVPLRRVTKIFKTLAIVIRPKNGTPS
jgi:hypothetical protein